jgi:hypothetical protein
MPDKQQLTTDVAIALERLINVQKDVDSFRIKLKDEYVTIIRYAPVEKIVYGMVGLILVTVLGTGLAFILKK